MNIDVTEDGTDFLIVGKQTDAKVWLTKGVIPDWNSFYQLDIRTELIKAMRIEGFNEAELDDIKLKLDELAKVMK